MRAVFTLIITLIILAGGVIPPSGSAQSLAATPAFISQAFVSGVNETKFPHLTATGATVHMAANVNRLNATYWSRAATAASFSAPTILGPAEDQPDYSTTSITSGPDGTLYYVWVNQPQQTIYLRSKAPNAAEWAPAQVVAAGQTFPVFPEVAVASDGAIFVAWRNPDKPFVWRRSGNGGVTWGPITDLSEENGVNAPAMAAGPNGAVAIAYTAPAADALQIFVAVWDGSAFISRRISPGGGNYADPSITIGPDGVIYVAWRGIDERGSHSGVFFAERKADGSYPIARLIDGKIAGRVSIIADQNRNLHVLWTAAGGSGFQLWYANKPATGTWSGPVAAPDAGGMIFNAQATVTFNSDGSIDAHAASEVFSGSRVLLRQYRFRSGLSGVAVPASAIPILARNAIATRDTAIPVQFVQIEGAPIQVRYRWDAPPTDADPWLPFATEITVPAPQAAVDCQEYRLYTQVRNATSIQHNAVSGPVFLDRAVQARVSPGATNGMAGISNDGRATWRIEDAGDCSVLDRAFTDDGAPPSQAIYDPRTSVTFNLPLAEGSYTRTLTLTDFIGNSAVYTGTFTVDMTAPQMQASAPLTITANPQATVLNTIDLDAVGYADQGSALPWAAAIAVSPTTPISEATGLSWVNMPLDPQRMIVTAAENPEQLPQLRARIDVSLADLFDSMALEPGTYHYAVALIDRAGNRSESWATGSITLNNISYPTLYLPLLRN